MPDFFVIKSGRDKSVLYSINKGQNCPIRVIIMTKEPIILALITRRKAANLTQKEAASMAGLSLKSYQRIEDGTGDIRLNNYLALTRNLGITDLDIALDSIGISGVTPWDVAAAARVLPPEARAALVSMIMITYRDVVDKA